MTTKTGTGTLAWTAGPNASGSDRQGAIRIGQQGCTNVPMRCRPPTSPRPPPGAPATSR
jgi:hypothetical protein